MTNTRCVVHSQALKIPQIVEDTDVQYGYGIGLEAPEEYVTRIVVWS